MPTATTHPGSTRAAAADSRAVRRAKFYREGEFWTLGFVGTTFRLKDSKGIGYIANLLRNPALEFHVLDLVGGSPGHREDEDLDQPRDVPSRAGELEQAGLHVGGLGDAGEMLDERARTEYRRRIAELREALDSAKEAADLERAEAAEAEIEALTREVARAVGLGGRNRRAASASERARQSVTKTIKAVIERIAESDAELAGLISRCVRTGAFCSYQPVPDSPVVWEFSASDTPDASIRARGDSTPEASVPGVSAVFNISPLVAAERTAFVGRDSERETIQWLIDSARKGRGAVVMIGGGSGVGKTRLATEMARYAERSGFQYAVGHCYERDEPVPYLPFAEIIESAVARATNLGLFRQRMGNNAAELAQIAPSLRRIFHDIPAPIDLPVQQKRRYLFQALLETVARAAQIQPRLFVLDDLQWADESTLALLVHLTRRVAQIPLVIIGTYRDGYSESNRALGRTLEELIKLGIRPLRLGGLSKDATAKILSELSQCEVPESLVNAVFEESQGNPFFVGELWRHLVEDGKAFDAEGKIRGDIRIDEIDVPETIRLVVGRRLERFNPDELRVLAAAAVIGRSFSFKLLSAVCQTDADDLFSVIENAQRMAIIASSNEGPETPFTFAHELLRQTLLSRISAARREQLHARVAQSIEQLYPAALNERAGEISNHLLKAKSLADAGKLVSYLTIAGNNALTAAAFEEARSCFETAISHADAAAAKDKAELLANVAIAESGLERWDLALSHLRASLEIYLGIGDREVIGRSFSTLTDALVFAGRYQDAIEIARRGLAHLGKEVGIWRVRLLDALSQSLAGTEGYEPAHAALDEARELAARLDDRHATARVIGAQAIVDFHFLRLHEAVEGFQHNRSIGSEISPWERVLQFRVLYPTLAYLGRIDEAQEVANELEELAGKIGQSIPMAMCQTGAAWIDFSRSGDLNRLATNLEPIISSNAAAQFGFWVVSSEEQLGIVEFFRGNWNGALAHAHAACSSEPGSSSEGVGTGTLFRQLAYAGDRAAALSLLDRKKSWMPTAGRPNARGSWAMLAYVIEGLAMLQERKRVAELYPLARELVATGLVAAWPLLRFIQTVAGIAAGAAGEWSAAEDHFRIAMQQATAMPHLVEQAEIRRFHAMMLLDRGAEGDRERARALLSDAVATYARIGMPRHVQIVQSMLH
jgi:tetratricopeptide (TPR) repeat protein